MLVQVYCKVNFAQNFEFTEILNRHEMHVCLLLLFFCCCFVFVFLLLFFFFFFFLLLLLLLFCCCCCCFYLFYFIFGGGVVVFYLFLFFCFVFVFFVVVVVVFCGCKFELVIVSYVGNPQLSRVSALLARGCFAGKITIRFVENVVWLLFLSL